MYPYDFKICTQVLARNATNNKMVNVMTVIRLESLCRTCLYLLWEVSCMTAAAKRPQVRNTSWAAASQLCKDARNELNCRFRHE